MRLTNPPRKALRTASFLLPIFLGALPKIASAEFFLKPWKNWHLSERTYNIGAELGYYSTHQNFDAVGDLQLPSELDRYSRIYTDLELSAGLSKRISFYGRTSWARVELAHASQPGSAFGFADQTLGVNIRLYERNSSVALAPGKIDIQAQLDLPAYNNNSAASTGIPFLGDGSSDATLGAFISVPLAQNISRSIVLTGGAGYTRRSSGFSAAVPWSWTAEYRPTASGSFFGSIGMNGLYSLLTDSTFGSTRSSIGAGGSLIVNAINPSIANLNGTIGYQLTRQIEAFISGTYAAVGQRAPAGFLASLGLRARLGRNSEKEYQYGNRGFVSYSLDAPVLRTNDRLNLLKIGKGKQDGVAVGQIFDIFEKKKDNSEVSEAVARARVIAVRFDDADVAIEEVFKEIWIEEGFIAKRLID